jgi:recombination protein RecT
MESNAAADALKGAITAKEKARPYDTLSAMLTRSLPEIEKALPKHLSPERMTRLALTAFSNNPALQTCEPRTILSSLMLASQLGLEPGVNGQGYLIPYKDTCTFVPGWRGLVDIVNRSGRATVYTGVIYADQRYTFTDGARRDLVIHNESACIDPADITHAYAIGWLNGAEHPVVELWPVAKIIKHRDKFNKVGSSHYSYRHPEMYYRKIALLQVLKYMPQSIELSDATEAVYAHDEGRIFEGVAE